MIVGIKVSGGLGNQMFQYAFGRAVSIETGAQLYLDLAWYYNIPERDTKRNFELNCYPYQALNFRSDDVSPFWFHHAPLPGKLLRKICQHTSILKDYIVESDLNYDPGVKKITRSTYFDGHWQSPKYFEKIKDQLFNDFLPNELSERTQRLSEEMKEKESVAIHIRRGDYVSNEYAHQNHFVCDKEYYLRAIQLIKDKVSAPHFYFFSDDPVWAKEEFGDLEDSSFIEGEENTPWSDLYLISSCKHKVIANSSFSWWGAWLSNYEEAIVIAPKTWFTDGREMNDLIPDTWVRV